MDPVSIIAIICFFVIFAFAGWSFKKHIDKPESYVQSSFNSRSVYVDISGRYEVDGGEYLGDETKANVKLIDKDHGNVFTKIIYAKDLLISNPLVNMIAKSAPVYYDLGVFDNIKSKQNADNRTDERELKRKLEMERGENERIVKNSLEEVRAVIKAGSSKSTAEK